MLLPKYHNHKSQFELKSNSGCEYYHKVIDNIPIIALSLIKKYKLHNQNFDNFYANKQISFLCKWFKN